MSERFVGRSDGKSVSRSRGVNERFLGLCQTHWPSDLLAHRAAQPWARRGFGSWSHEALRASPNDDPQAVRQPFRTSGRSVAARTQPGSTGVLTMVLPYAPAPVMVEGGGSASSPGAPGTAVGGGCSAPLAGLYSSPTDGILSGSYRGSYPSSVSRVRRGRNWAVVFELPDRSGLGCGTESCPAGRRGTRPRQSGRCAPASASASVG